MADAYARLARFLPVLHRQLEGTRVRHGPRIADFVIGARLDRGPDYLDIDLSLERLRQALLGHNVTREPLTKLS